MAFNTASPRAEYTASAGQTLFSFVFKIYNDTDIKVYKTLADEAPNETDDLLILDTDYSVAIDGDAGGSITLLSAASISDAITLLRDLPTTREIEYQTSGDLLAETLNDDQEYQTYLLADNKQVSNRTLVFEENLQGMENKLPTPEALKPFRWKADGKGIENYTPPTFGEDDVQLNIFNVDHIAEMLTIDPNIYPTVNVRGYHSVNDGGGGLFNYDASQSAVNNHGTIINGWVRQYSGAITSEMFGAYGDGTTDDYQAIVYTQAVSNSFLMKDAQYRISSDITFPISPIFSNASLVIDSGITVTFNDKPNAVREHIFKGDGDILLNDEGSHFAFPEWFGAFANKPSTDAGVLLQKLSDSVVAGRECIVDFGDGTWYLQTGVIWSRACLIQGSGDRITHFRCTGSLATVGDVFTTADEGVQFRDIQFSSSSIRTSGRYISLLHNYCKAYRIWFTDGFQGIKASGALCSVDIVQGFSWNTAADSYIVLNNGNSNIVKNITFTGTTNAPEYVVKIGTSTTTCVDNIRGSGSNIQAVVGLVVSFGNIEDIIVSKIFANNTVDALKILSTGTGGARDIIVNEIVAESCTGNGVTIDKQGSGIMKYISVSEINTEACDNGIKAISTSSKIEHLLISSATCRGSTSDGITIDEAQYFTINNSQAISNTGNGINIELGCTNFILTSNQSLFNGTDFTDNSGAVT